MLRRSGSGYAEPVERIEDAATFEAAYNTVRHIGAGASGRVLLVEHRRTRAKCVLKKIPMTSMKDAGPVMKEVHLLSQLDHPNITRYHGSWHADGCLNILMEYADGGALSDALRGRHDDAAYLDEDVIMDWFIQVTRAVHYIHERKIVHRDLKAQNVLLTKRGLIKVCDFGISKCLEETSGGSAGLASTCIGTPYYLSPEIVEAKKYGLPTDIWSLGVLLYEMAALKKPFEADSLPALAMRITRAAYDELPACFSDELRALVRSLLQREPADRPSATDLLNDDFFVQHEDRFNAQLAELAELAQGLVSARASFCSPPVSHRHSVLTPPRARESAAPAPMAAVAEATIVSAPSELLVDLGLDDDCAPRGRAVSSLLDSTLPASALEPRLLAPQADATPTPSPAPRTPTAVQTLGRSSGLSAAREALVALPPRGMSLPGTSAHAHGAGEPPASGRGSVGHLLHVAATSPQAERAIACALRHELVIETSENTELTPSRLRASLEDNLRFSLNMQALESNLADAAAYEHDASDDSAVEQSPAAGARGAAAASGAQPRCGGLAAAPAAQDARADAREGAEAAAQPVAAAVGAEAERPAPLDVAQHSGFVTTRRSRRGERSKARPTVSLATFMPPSPPRVALQESNS